jgi:hypothetical protein
MVLCEKKLQFSFLGTSVDAPIPFPINAGPT